MAKRKTKTKAETTEAEAQSQAEETTAETTDAPETEARAAEAEAAETETAGQATKAAKAKSTAKAKSAKQTTATADPAQIYLGPRVMVDGCPLSPNTHFRGGKIPVRLAQAVEEDADLAALFFPVTELGRAMARKRAGELDAAIQAVQETYAPKKKEG